jgi:hypothetical protein
MRYSGLLIAALLVLLTSVTAQEDAEASPPLVGWEAGAAVAWTSPDAAPEPLYPPETPRIPYPEMLSPDGRYVVYGVGEEQTTITEQFPRNFDSNGLILHDLSNGETQVITPPGDDMYSWNITWSPDGDQVAWIRRSFEDDTETIRLEIYDLARPTM